MASCNGLSFVNALYERNVTKAKLLCTFKCHWRINIPVSLTASPPQSTAIPGLGEKCTQRQRPVKGTFAKPVTSLLSGLCIFNANPSWAQSWKISNFIFYVLSYDLHAYSTVKGLKCRSRLNESNGIPSKMGSYNNKQTNKEKTEIRVYFPPR